MSLTAAQLADAPRYSQEHKQFLPAKAARLAEILRDYNPYLELQFIPDNQRDGVTAPFRIWDNSPWRGGYPVKSLSAAEIEEPEKILAWLFQGDLSKRGLSDIMNDEEARQVADALVQAKRDEDIAAERQELAAEILKGGRYGKSVYRHNGKVFRR